MVSPEVFRRPNERLRKFKTRTYVIAGMVATPVLLGSIGFALLASSKRNEGYSEPSICMNQNGTQEGQLPGGTPTLPATEERPSLFVITPDRSNEQSFSIRPADNPQNEWNTVKMDHAVGIVGIATEDTVFDMSGGKAVWGKTCLPNAENAKQEAASHVSDLCARKDFGFREVVVYKVEDNRKPALTDVRKC